MVAVLPHAVTKQNEYPPLHIVRTHESPLDIVFVDRGGALGNEAFYGSVRFADIIDELLKFGS